jgi:hypothetical protein
MQFARTSTILVSVSLFLVTVVWLFRRIPMDCLQFRDLSYLQLGNGDSMCHYGGVWILHIFIKWNTRL